MSPVRVSNVLMRGLLPFLDLNPFHWCSWPTTVLENQFFSSWLQLPLNPLRNANIVPYVAIFSTWCRGLSVYPKDTAFSGLLIELMLVCIWYKVEGSSLPFSLLSLKFHYKSGCWACKQYIFYLYFEPDLITQSYTKAHKLFLFTCSIPMQYAHWKGGIQLVHCIQLKDILFLYAFKCFKFVSS